MIFHLTAYWGTQFVLGDGKYSGDNENRHSEKRSHCQTADAILKVHMRSDSAAANGWLRDHYGEQLSPVREKLWAPKLNCTRITGGAMHYHDSDDLKRLAEFKQLAPTEFSAFVEFDKTVGREDGTIPRKYRELIAIAVACTTQCPYCLDVHTRAAKRAGATREEVSEAAMLAAALRAGAAITHGALAVKLFDQDPAAQAAVRDARK
jgi:AhpD family alkylhydroperoxidase